MTPVFTKSASILWLDLTIIACYSVSLLAVVFTPFSLELETLLVFLSTFSVDEMIYGMIDLTGIWNQVKL